MTNIGKELYHGFFNWSGETHEFYTHAVSPSRAFHIMITKLAKKVQQSRASVLIRFVNDQSDNYKIEREI